jgi:hypothetical protein
MTKTIQVSVKINLHTAIQDGEIVREVIQAIMDGEPHHLIDSTELVEFSTDEKTLTTQELLKVSRSFSPRTEKP